MLGPTVLEPLTVDWAAAQGVEIAVLRLDLIDPLLSGNKWFKLRLHLEGSRQRGCTGLISLGGPHSNHLHALAAAGQRLGLSTVGLLRGHETSTPTIIDLRRFGMHLHWLGYGGYRERHQADFWGAWQARYPRYHCVPEGGGGLEGALGCAMLVEQVEGALPAFGWQAFDAWWLAAGTGTTMAGLVIGERATGRLVYGALAGPGAHRGGDQVAQLLREAGVSTDRYEMLEASGKGFGRFDRRLAQFIFDIEEQTRLPLEPVYTAKALLALRQHVEAGRFEPGARVVFVHTGGLQGRRAAEPLLRQLRRRHC
ncbi:1-aminocyclopropane-1-carboxylate deaminase/D-cysteine desulfhydrase [Stutzerimonas tarimensis]|uniref:1-aminocyclopropane-1-carboxylate deaminase/D-cysteine desulfhydrase n=1 Tax=Stutzerimonas tarimensis TaxID=1507735 RepID=A0ABV7T3G0_9GAMM